MSGDVTVSYSGLMPLPNSPEQPQPLRVVVHAVKDWVERCGEIWVSGQVIELRRRRGSTHFITLRDLLAEVSVTVTIGTAALDAAGPISTGTTVTALVKPTVWATSGRLSFACRDLRPAGEGQLLAQLEQRKRMLQAEGLFASDLKQPLPFLPRRVGLVTAQGSAAEKDVVENLRRRWPAVQVQVAYAAMQGPSCALEVVEAVAELDRDPSIDVIVIARGGGSLEDLLPFSDESVVRAVHRARTPVVSAIGHEVDTPILDLVADARASTPTDAARLVVPDVVEQAQVLQQARQRLRASMTSRLDSALHHLGELRRRPVLRDPLGPYRVHDNQVTEMRDRARRALRASLDAESRLVATCRQRARAMSPQQTLERGYAILSAGDGTCVTSVHHVSPGDNLLAQVTDGQIGLTVHETRPRPRQAR